MGRGLARHLAAEGCHVAMCDIFEEKVIETKALCEQNMPAGTRITTHQCDVGVEDHLLRLRDEVAAQHNTDHVHLVFNNAGIGGGGSIINSPRETWDRTFAVCWGGVYWGTRAFMPMLQAADEGHLINTSSVNGFWATLGPMIEHTAYSAAKFAVKGFTEALITDLAINAPHVKASVVMPGHIGTGIAGNTVLAHGVELDADASERAATFRNTAPIDGDQAAVIILDAVRAGQWRILVGDDAHALDMAVRDKPEEAYDHDFVERLGGHFDLLDRDE